ncbi:MAG TPA: sigma-70 family RNA polymerase sigma factor [Verrucomicrobiales bacterium]|nr:sigma-70 family RNA polymerase sigma factor [Verrucomicrobiales bacterium]HIL71369.1 sigma-70 family RNA polymerase sigma factor [Verrucomicrobiota bacterium]
MAESVGGKNPDVQTTTAQPVEWLELYGDFLYRYAVSRVFLAAVAEDLVQETLIAGIKSFHKFGGRSSLKSWLTGIMKHKILDYFRKVSRELPGSREFSDDVHGAWFDEDGHWNREIDVAGMDWEPDPSQVLEQKEFWGVLQSCLSHLPAKSAQAFVQREMELQAPKEILKNLNITESNLWVLLHRARNQLRRCLKVNWVDLNTEKQK